MQQKGSPFAFMGQFVPEEDIKIYNQALGFSKLIVDEQIHSRLVRIYEEEHVHEVYTKKNDKLPHMVMLHGYGATSLIFVRLFQKLYDHYQVHSLDCFGIGYSSRGKWNDTFTPEQAEEYLVDFIEQWRIKVQIDQFQLVGHSFGGYIGMLYTKKYPKRVKRLVLISPVGMVLKTAEERSWLEAAQVKFAAFFYNLRVRPFGSIHYPLVGRIVLEIIMARDLKLRGREKQLWKSYFLNMNRFQKSSEKSFYVLFQWPFVPVRGTIMDFLKTAQISFPVEVYYGDSDWMESRFNAVEKIRKQFRPEKVHCEKIPNSAHNVMIDNPEVVLQRLLKQNN